MAFLLSSSTLISIIPDLNISQVVSDFGDRVASINVTSNSQMSPLYQLTSINNTDPVYDLLVIYKINASVSLYAPGPFYSTLHAIACEEAGTLDLKIEPGFCGEAITGISFSDQFYVNAYSYKKSTNSYGIETWGMQSKSIYLDDEFNEEFDTTQLRGVAMGTTTTPSSSYSGDFYPTGIKFADGTQIVNGHSINLSAGNPGLGQANITKHGRIIQIGGGIGPGDFDGQAQVNIPYTTLPAETV